MRTLVTVASPLKKAAEAAAEATAPAPSPAAPAPAPAPAVGPALVLEPAAAAEMGNARAEVAAVAAMSPLLREDHRLMQSP